MKTLLLLVTCLIPTSFALAAGESGGPTLPIQIRAPKDWKVSLNFARKKVAAGAIKNDAHQSEFTVRILDSKGKPVVGSDVSLPKIVKGGLGPKKEMAAKLEWKADFLTVKQTNLAKTDKKGEVRGIYTSGNRTETVNFEAMGVAQDSIQQVWNEKLEPFDDTDVLIGEPTVVGFTMYFEEGGKHIPIVGHTATLEPNEVRFLVTDPTLGPDEDEDGKPDGESKTITVTDDDPEDPFWKAFLLWSKWDYPIYEDKPGHYVGKYIVNLPEGAILNGLTVDSVENVNYWFFDDMTYGEDGMQP